MTEKVINGIVVRHVPANGGFFRHTGNVFIKQMYFEMAGETNIGHSHKHDHITLVAHGKVLVSVEGKFTEYEAPNFIDIEAGKHHLIQALTDGACCYCVHDTRGIDPEDLGESFMEKHA